MINLKISEHSKELDLNKVKTLKANIKEFGLKLPIEVCFDKKGQCWLIDGRHRLQALNELINENLISSVPFVIRIYSPTERFIMGIE